MFGNVRRLVLSVGLTSLASLDTGITYANFTTATLGYSGLASNALDGQNYRVKITSANGTEEVISNGAGTLTFGS